MTKILNILLLAAFIAVLIVASRMHILGLQGMVRRIASYDPQYQNWNIASRRFFARCSDITFYCQYCGGVLVG